MLSGSRSVQENFFIDPLTGNSYSTSDHNFLGIESVWNNLNYYVNMQDCSNGCAVSQDSHGYDTVQQTWTMTRVCVCVCVGCEV